MFETWVRIIFINNVGLKVSENSYDYESDFNLTLWWFPLCLAVLQEDDMDGIHIVAFAEEEDPGLSSLVLFLSWMNITR